MQERKQNTSDTEKGAVTPPGTCEYGKVRSELWRYRPDERDRYQGGGTHMQLEQVKRKGGEAEDSPK